jgi:hypothetical protein
MTGIERRRYEMLVRVRNFGQTHASLFASSPAVQKTFALLDATINELTTTDGRKLAAKTSARGDRKAVARRALKDLLTRVSLLSKNLSAEGRPMPALELPGRMSRPACLRLNHAAGFESSRQLVEPRRELVEAIESLAVIVPDRAGEVGKIPLDT